MKKIYCIIGRHGFLGSALEKRLGSNRVSSFPTKDTKVLFHFGSPVHPPFEESPDYHMNEVISSFLYLLPYCRDHNIKFVFPSSALVYEKQTTFAKTKMILEMMASCYPNTLALRIFPVYGPGENRTVIAQWCKDMKKGKRPSVYGDGKQERDFIYIEDAVNQIITYSIDNTTGVKDIGIGHPTSFNYIISVINEILGKQLKPKYKKAPKNYSEGIWCEEAKVLFTPIYYGITKVLEQ